MTNDKELGVVKMQVSKAMVAVNSLAIDTSMDYAKADELLSKVKQVGKIIKAKKEEITKPLNESLKAVRELFKPIEQDYENCEDIIKRKMLDFRITEEKRIESEKVKIANKVESGYIKNETAIEKLNEVGDVKENLKEVGVKSSTRKLPRVRILDEMAIPREYLGIDMTKVLNDLKVGKTIAGAELYYETIIA